MQSILYSTISEGDVLLLFGVGKKRLEQWKLQGLVVRTDGRFSLSKVCRWREARHKIELAARLKTDGLSQNQVAELLGVSRQTLTAWSRYGQPCAKEGYSLPVVVRWLRCHYLEVAKKEYTKHLATVRKKLRRNIRQVEKFLK